MWSQRRRKNRSGSSRRMLWLISRRVWKYGLSPVVTAEAMMSVPSTSAHSVRVLELSAMTFIVVVLCGFVTFGW